MTFRYSLNRVSIALGGMSLLEELRYLAKLSLLGPEHTDLQEAVDHAACKLEHAIDALPAEVDGANTWARLRGEIVKDMEKMLAALDDADFAAACDHMRTLRDSVAVGRSYLAANESADAPAPAAEKSAGWSLDELTADLRAHGIDL
jgi:hypothetical protein